MFDASPQEYVGRSLLRPSRPPRHLSWQIDQQDLAGRGASDLEPRLTLDRGGVALTERLAVHRDAALRHEHVRAPAGGERVGHALSGVELRRVQRDILMDLQGAVRVASRNDRQQRVAARLGGEGLLVVAGRAAARVGENPDLEQGQALVRWILLGVDDALPGGPELDIACPGDSLSAPPA